MTILLTISLLYIAVYAGLFARGDGSNYNRPALFYNPMVYRGEKGLIRIRDHVFSALLLTPFYTVPFIYYFQLEARLPFVGDISPYWYVLIYAVGVCIGGLRSWRSWFNYDNSFGADYRAGITRMRHYAALFIPLGLCAGGIGLGLGVIATLIYALVAPLAYWFRAKNQWIQQFRYRSQMAEACHALLYSILSAGILLWA